MITPNGVGVVERAVRSDLFNAIEGQYDLIVSNPPYVDAGEIERMPPEYRHEPMLGLAAGEDGLRVVERIMEAATTVEE